MAIEDLPKKPNILIIMTDQQRHVQHWPPGWAAKNLPNMARLMKNGITFNRAYSSTCMCSPSRTTFFTGLYPSQHGVTEVLSTTNKSFNISATQTTTTARDLQGIFKSSTQSMARIMQSAGYHVEYKGKWHLTKPVYYNTDDPASGEAQLQWTDLDIPHIAERWGFHGWNPPDAGDTITASDMGGGEINNDGRFVDGHGTADGLELNDTQQKLAKERSVLNFLNTYDSEKPFCLIVSLVNPHDVLSYPGTGSANEDEDPIYVQGGYNLDDFKDLPIDLPPTVHEDLDTKPSVQKSVKMALDMGMGFLKTKEEKLNYVRFYAYLNTVVDKEIGKVLHALDKNGFTDDTIIVRVSDHGEMGLSHGGLRQKLEVMYDEAIKVPLIFSNPILFPKPVVTDSLAGLVDVLPTLTNLVGAPDRDRWTFKGKDLSPILSDPKIEVQDCLHFTYDDYDTSYPVSEPARIRAIIEKDWKYAVYYDTATGTPAEYEMYNLVDDPLETKNLAHPKFSKGYEEERQRLHRKLTQRMEALGTVPDEIIWPKVSGVDPTATKDTDE